MSDDDVPSSFQFDELRYIKTRAKGDKRPAEKWGGYDQDFNSADGVYTHDDVLGESSDTWAVCGISDQERATRALLVFDLDVHKADGDFDFDRVEVPNDTAIVKSQNGGMHVYFALANHERGEAQESDFQMTTELSWDIDIRGSFVSHHVVAPGEIPGVDTDYELRNDEDLLHVTDPRDAASLITLDGEPLLEYQPDTGVGSFDFDRSGDAPDEMPTCYHRGLQLRKANPDDHPNTHKVNTLTALCGLAAGYDVDEMVAHFCDDFAPGEDADREQTRYQLQHMAGKFDLGSLAPPAVSTLRDYGILDGDESCNCDIEYHGSSGTTSTHFDVIELAAESEGDDDTMSTTETESTAESIEGDDNRETLHEAVMDVLREYDRVDEMTQKTVIHRVAQAITEHRDYVYPRKAVGDWKSTLHRYDPALGVYVADGEEQLESLCETLLGDFLTNSQASELQGKVRRMNHARKGELGTGPNRLVVKNGILDLHTGELDEHTPDEFHRSRIGVPYDPTAECPRIDEFFHDIVEPKDVGTLYQLVAHTLYGEYIDEKAAMLVGDGENGKSVFLDLIERFIGGDNVSHRSLQELSGGRFAASDLHNKWANFHPDMSDEEIKDLGMFKKLTGRDTMQADVKYQDPITFENRATLIFAANSMPELDEDTHALWRRWVYINFPNTFEDGDEGTVPKRVLMEELTDEDELQGLLARCVDELSEWRDGRQLFDSVMGADQVREKMKRAAEPVYAFATACLEESDDGKIPKGDVRDAYRTFAREEDLPTMSSNVFGEDLVNIRDLKVEESRRRIDGSRTPCYTGVEWTGRGRQVAGLDGLDDENQGAIDDDPDGGRDRADNVRDVMIELGADDEPMSEAMVIGRASTRMGPKQAEYAIDDLRDRGVVYSPADADDDEIMLS